MRKEKKKQLFFFSSIFLIFFYKNDIKIFLKLSINKNPKDIINRT